MKTFSQFILCLCLCLGVAHAKTIYKSIDSNGTIVFTDKPRKDIQQEKISLNDDSNPEEQRQIKALKQHLKRNHQDASRQRQIAAAKHKLREAQIQLRLMQKRDTASFAKCLKKKALLQAEQANDTYYICKHTPLLAYQQAVIEASQQLQKLTSD